MRPAVSFLLFFVAVFLIGLIWMTLNSFALEPLHDAVNNVSGINHDPYPIVTTVNNYLWLGIPIVGAVCTAIYLAFDKGD